MLFSGSEWQRTALRRRTSPRPEELFEKLQHRSALTIGNDDVIKGVTQTSSHFQNVTQIVNHHTARLIKFVTGGPPNVLNNEKKCVFNKRILIKVCVSCS